MSGPRIFETEWINLVFEGKNKEYGAYQLRRENPKTTIKAFLLGLCLITALAMLPYLLSSFGKAPGVPTPTIPDAGGVVIAILPPKDPEAPKPIPNTPPAAPNIERPDQPTIDDNPVIVDAPLETPDLGEGTNSTPTAESGASGQNTVASGAPGGGGESPAPATSPAIEAPIIVVDKMPEYPGGLKKFYEYIKRNFNAPDADETDGNALKVFVSFVVEKDGSISDIQVVKSPGYGLDKEAKRVLKSMKVKWIPGLVAGKPVRTVYNLPIAIQPQK